MQTLSWNPQQTPLILTQKIAETHDVSSFFLQTPESQPFNFKPGQFLTVKLDINGQILARSYSVSSLPGQSILQLTIKRVPGGTVSNWMIDNLHTGDTLRTYGFAGEFNICDLPPQNRVLFLSAGCGITPVMSMTRHLLNHFERKKISIDFIHCARNPQNIIYREELIRIAKTHPEFHLHFVLEHSPADTASTTHPNIHFYEGLINQRILQKIIQNNPETSIYMCGPPVFMRAVENILHESNFDMRNLFQETFISESFTNQLSETILSNKKETCTVSLPDFNVQKTIRVGSLLLDILEEEKIPVVSACRSGICGACKCKITKGKVISINKTNLSSEEQERGYVLACSSKIITDIEISL